MRRLLLALFVLGLIAPPAAAVGQQGSNAPLAMLSATTEGRFDWQMSKVVYSTWDGEEYDDSFPPVRWQAPMRTPAPELTVTIQTPDVPDSVRVRLWKRLRPNGIPKGKRRDIECHLDASPGQCTLSPSASPEGLAWKVDFEPPWRGRNYLAVVAEWPDAQVVWINHAFLTH